MYIHNYSCLVILNSHEVLLEGETQKAFGPSLSLFMEFSEVVCRLREVLNNLVRQVDSIYSSDIKNNKLFASFTIIHMPSVFSSFDDSLTVFLIVDEIISQNGHVKHYASLFMRILDAVKMEPNKFYMSTEIVDFLDHESISTYKGFCRLLQGHQGTQNWPRPFGSPWGGEHPSIKGSTLAWF